MGRGGLVDRDGPELAVLPLLGQHALRVLLQLAEGVAAAVRTLHRQTFRLEPADLAQRREPARLRLQVEHRHFDRRRPGLAVAVAEPVAPLAAPVEDLPRDDLARLRRRGGREARHERQRDSETGPELPHDALSLAGATPVGRASAPAGAVRRRYSRSRSHATPIASMTKTTVAPSTGLTSPKTRRARSTGPGDRAGLSIRARVTHSALSFSSPSRNS